MESPRHPASISEEKLVEQCQSRRQRRSGPGGQHRNKVETAVVFTHTSTGIQGSASERRSQEENRQEALFRLRVNLALEVRTSSSVDAAGPSALWRSRCRDGRISVSSQHLDFPALLAEALDELAGRVWDVKAAAEALQCTSSQLVRFLQQEPRAAQLLNDQRAALGLKRYR